MEQTITKATHEKIELWQPVVKNSEGKYIAVLSDDSIDRDYEIVGAEALNKIKNNDGYTAILINHENNVLGQIGEWVNKRIETIKGHTAFVAEPKFYESNPNAKIIKGCLDEGAKYGISIGAIPKSWKDVEKNGETFRMYTELELLEASFVAIPSNRHGMAMAVAKAFDKAKRFCNKNLEELKMSEEELNKPADNEAAEEESTDSESTEEVPTDKKFTQIELDKAVSDSKDELSKGLNEQLEKMKSDHEKELSEMSKKYEDMEKKAEDLTAELEKLKKMSVMKGDMSTVENIEGQKPVMKEGELPVIKKI